MTEPQATSLERQARRMFEFLEAMDTSAMAAMLADDAQGIDEISRRWMRGRSAIESYFGELSKDIGDVRSQIGDLQATEWNDTGVVACVVDQTYTLNAEPQRVTAPTSMTFRREDGEWKLAVFHFAPLPEPAGD